MKTFYSILFVSISLLLSSCDWIDRVRQYSRYSIEISKNDSILKEGKCQTSFFPLEFNETSRLYYICKVWGFVKYYHENLQDEKAIDIDNILINAIQESKHCDSKEAFQLILINIISSIQISSMNGVNPYPDLSDYMLIDNYWMSDTVYLTPSITAKLLEIFSRHTGKETYFIQNDKGTGLIILANENQYPDHFPDETVRLIGLFKYWNIINYFFVYKNFMDANWDKVLYESIPSFQKINSNYDYHLEIARLVNRLDDAHANMPTLENEIIIGQYAPNFNIKNICDTFVIQDIILKENNNEGFQVGDIILQINGHNTQHLYDSLKNFVGSGSFWSEQRLVGYMMTSSHDSIQEFTILRNGKDTMKIISNHRLLRDINQSWYIKNKDKKPFYWINDRIAYLDLMFLSKNNFDENYDSIRQAKNIILT